MIFDRTNARLGSDVQLVAEFFNGGVYADPEKFDGVEIYRGGDRLENGGTLVDVIDPVNIVRLGVGRYSIVFPLLAQGTSPETSPADGLHDSYFSNCLYYDSWLFREHPTGPQAHSVGLHFYVYPELFFVADDTSKFRFEMKLDRKRIVKGENLDIRLGIIPIPLYRSRRDPIVDYLLPISTMRARIVDGSNNEVVPWTVLRFTGKEGVLPTNLFATLQVAEYSIIAELILPNGQSVRYPRTPVQLID